MSLPILECSAMLQQRSALGSLVEMDLPKGRHIGIVTECTERRRGWFVRFTCWPRYLSPVPDVLAYEDQKYVPGWREG